MKKLVKKSNLYTENTIEAYCSCSCICQSCSCWGPDALAIGSDSSSNEQANYPDYQNY